MSVVIYKHGPCVLKSKCKCPHLELRPQHSCPDCHKIVHPLCGEFDSLRDKYACGCIKQKADMVLDEINIHSGDQLANVSTITHSTEEDESFREIPRDYFICKDQKINKKSRDEGGKDFTVLRSKILDVINEKLKCMMILKAQQIELQVEDKKTGESRNIQSFKDIGAAWKNNNDNTTAAKINTIINKTFTEKSGYEFYLETKILKQFKIKYADELEIKGSIARMIVMRKCELGKAINKRSEKTHQKKIVKVRMKHNQSNENKFQKINTNSFRIDNNWFNDDGSEYTGNNNHGASITTDDTLFYIEKIRNLEEELKRTKEV